LDRFDEILASIIDKYFLNIGPQTQSFGRSVLEESYAADPTKTLAEGIDAKLNALGYGPDGDRQLVEAILEFSRILLEKCGNRSLYSSSERLGDLLNTTSLSLLQATLRLSLCLAQRYHSRQRGSHQQTLLATHYNIDLEKLQKIAAPFPRPLVAGKTPFAANPAVSSKGTENAVQTKLNANEFASLVRDDEGWEEWGSVRVLYYPSGPSEQTRTASEFGQTDTIPHAPTTPTPLRRSATHPTPRSSRASNVEDSPTVAPNTVGKPDEPSRSGKVLDLPFSQVSSSKAEDLLATNLPHLPLESKYELLHKVRVAQALTDSRAAREQILAIRILAVTNLAYVNTEATFQQKVLQYDMEQSKRLQLTYQLAELVHLGASGDLEVSRTAQALALQALDGLAKHKARANDVCAALSVNVNHGVLMFLTRKVVNELGAEEDNTNDPYHDEWRDALLALLRTLPSSSSRTPETLVAAGLIPMFVDILNLRTEKARRVYSRVMEFLDTFVHAVRDALGTLTTAKGFDAISDLIDYETKTAFEKVSRGDGFPAQYKNPSIDYQIPYFQQQTLRWMFRFVNHIMQHNGGGFDRVLRNLIDSPQLLTSLRLVFENARIFGSHVWSNAVNILSSFIHNEPTSYAVIAEAGLSRSLLAAVMGRELQAKEKPPAVEPQDAESQEGESSAQAPTAVPASPAEEKKKGREYVLARSKDSPLAPGIIAAADALACIPSAFGAICLNSSGLDLFQSSDALESFFEIFENPEHVKCLKDDPNLVRSLGTTFDELVRHHPALKTSIMTAVLVMAARVNLLGKVKAWELGMGSKLWQEDADGQVVLSGDVFSLFREIGTPGDASTEAPAAVGAPYLNAHLLPNGGKLVLGDVNQLLPSPQAGFEPKDKDEHGLTVTDYLFPAIRFLGAFFENQPNCASFILAGGAEFILDYATLQSLPFDFHNTDANQELTVLVHMLAETKPHLILPSIMQRAQSAVDNLEAFWTAPKESGFFTPLIKPIDSKAPAPEPTPAVNHGTFFVKHLNAVLVLTDLLREIYAMPLYQTRSTTLNYPFSQVVLADKYAALAASLGNLHAACVWEEIMLEKNIPEKWLQAIKNPADKTGSNPATGTTQVNSSEASAITGAQAEGSGATEASKAPAAEEPETEESKAATERSAAFKNVQTLRYLLSSLPSSITGFFHNLGLGLITRKRMENSQTARQNSNMVADAIADAVLRQLQFGPANSCDSSKHRFAYLIVILSSFSHLLYEVTPERPSNNYLTLVLLAFKRNNGLKVLKEICDVFMREVKALEPVQNDPEKSNKELADRLTSAYGGIKIILALFSELASGKNIMESNQTQALASHHDRDRDRHEYFQAGQFIVDLRMEILPMAQDMWNSEFATQSSSKIVKCLVDILRSSLDGEHEQGAAHKSDVAPAVTEAVKKPFMINKDRLATLTGKGFEDSELNHEALYRCNNNANYAEEYCNARTFLRSPPRVPPGPGDVQTGPPEAASGADGPEDGGLGDVTPLDRGMLDQGGLAMLLAQAGRPVSDSMNDDDDSSAMRDGLARAISNVLNDEAGMLRGEDGPLFLTERERQRQRRRAQANTESADQQSSSASQPQREDQREEPVERRQLVTIEDLNAERENVRANLIERSLDVLNVHHDVSFELADLISSAIKNHPEPESFRRDIGETLVQSLVSLQMENFQTAGKKVAAYAHILALVLQDSKMYTATLEELKDCFSTFLSFIKLPTPEKSAGETFPWIGPVLLILEKLLSDDCQPPQITWSPPSLEDPQGGNYGPAHLAEPLVSLDQKTELFEALVEILPRIGKDDGLALSVCRMLVILTRQRSIAVRFAPKRNLQRLFLMVKQLANASNEKLQSAFMLILRHIVEDEATIRQIMTAEIVGNFESKPSRQIDAAGYVRQMYHLVLRNPEIFVEVSNEKLRLVRYDAGHRTQALALKEDRNARQRQDKEDKTQEPSAAEASSTAEDKEKEKDKAAEMKPPVVENPDGVIHYLLSELLSYKDVDDKETPTAESTEQPAQDQAELPTDIEMSMDEPTPSVTSSADAQTSRAPKKGEKPSFDAKDHPIYIYRCFLLQCLTELLGSYTRAKVEFINFSRKADPLASTPSKPRSGILNYMLNALVPLGTMEHDESLAFKKRNITSSWTMQALVALCTKTYELPGRRRNEPKPTEEDEPEVAFVRRFVLEHALRSFKEANASTEPLDVKYSKLMSLADLFDKMLSGYSFSQDAGFPNSARQIAKAMFEKHFIPALTASVAEIDLNFPSSKRVIKYILRPINKLTQTAVMLSDNGEISTASSGETEDDEISSATSVSDMEDEREETPDLFRHSTLGMLEPRHEEETSSEESEGEDDEMYDDEYDDEMDYDEDVPEDDGEVVSDEEDMGPIEGLPGDAVEVIIDDEDDEDDDDEDDDDDDDLDDHSEMEEDDDIYAGEITGDRDNESLDDGEDDEWESDEITEDEEEAEMMNQFEDELADMRQANRSGDAHNRIDELFRALNQATGDDDLHDHGLGGDIHDEILDDLNEEGGASLSRSFLHPLFANPRNVEEDEMDELEEEADDYDEYDMDHGSEGDMEGKTNTIICLVLNV
jgi:E3 ubiquitin-protein ligase HUWE1